MKAIRLFTLLAALCVAQSFTTTETANPSNAQFSATINGAPFTLREDELFRGLLMNRAASADGSLPNRTVVNTIFSGPTVIDEQGKMYTENIQLELTFDPENPVKHNGYSVVMQHNQQGHYLVKEGSAVVITGFEWEEDRKHFIISAKFACKMRSLNATTDKEDVLLKGHMQNIRVTVPGWLAERN